MIVSANRMADLTSLDYYFERLRRRLDGLTDDEYLWEPVSPCISIEPEHAVGPASSRAEWNR